MEVLISILEWVGSVFVGLFDFIVWVVMAIIHNFTEDLHLTEGEKFLKYWWTPFAIFGLYFLVGYIAVFVDGVKERLQKKR